MLEETTPRTSAAWRPTTTFASEMGMTEKGELSQAVIKDIENHGTAL